MRNLSLKFCSIFSRSHILLLCFFSLSCSYSSFSQDLSVASIFGDHMVVQQSKPVSIWGQASPNETITISFAGQSKIVKASTNGKWKVKLNSLKATKTGRELTIKGENNTIVISDVLVGEVWICSGQSNMQWGVNNVPEINGLIPFAKNIRSFEVTRTVAIQEQEDIYGEWTKHHPASAVAFAFAYFLEDLGDVPIGIIHASWGSSSIEAWMARELTKELPHFDTIMQEFDLDKARLNRINSILKKKESWPREDDIYLRRQPNILYNAMIHPLIPFTCRGVLWYQGERNTRYMSGMPEIDVTNWFHRVCGMKDYGKAIKKWTLNLRQKWDDPDLHMMAVMLPGFGGGTQLKIEIDPESPTEQSWAWMRESQLTLLELSNTSVINTIDLGDVKNIHPWDKLPIGQRAALLAAKANLDYDGIVHGPIMSKVESEQGNLVVHFENAKGLRTSNGKQPEGFWISDKLGNWKKALAKIEGNTVVLSSDEITNPAFIRYAFAGKPEVNLINESGLPAFPFRTDTWDE